MSTPSKATKSSRITIACNACRFRKQKCSGKRPVCTQCLQHNRICNWPEQLKRGPAKGYIEALEHRLHETENVLLRVLAQASDSQLSAALVGERQMRSDEYSPFLRAGKRGAEYWKEFPLDTVSSVRRWQRDCSGFGGGASGRDVGVDADFGTRSPGERAKGKAVRGYDRSSSQVSCDAHPSRSLGDGGRVSSRSTSPIADKQQDKSGVEKTGTPIQDTTARLTSAEQSQADVVPDRSSTPREPNLWSGAPSVNFQQQFLW
ncbi:hypothetical protein BDV25DRAFT_142334 [Aspergillus avenaceus]|uniref:Zn(2)-C6 fungal-type domain-containing protein n=1 Tax=Aspergillus avenaceus TaxID=36643 RepID=A0A5N6TNB9_ASPAV|nr:hypothetical protein BDV25DRAFT_142334 [Aspergillus avenaceus]